MVYTYLIFLLSLISVTFTTYVRNYYYGLSIDEIITEMVSKYSELDRLLEHPNDFFGIHSGKPGVADAALFGNLVHAIENPILASHIKKYESLTKFFKSIIQSHFTEDDMKHSKVYYYYYYYYDNYYDYYYYY